MSACAKKLRARIDRYLPMQLQEAVVVPDDLLCERKMIVVNGPSGAGKTEYLRAKYPRYVAASTDHLQYTGPCRQLLFGARERGPDEDAFETCEDLGSVVSGVVYRESVKVGANVAFESTGGDKEPPSYKREFVLVFRPFEEAFANMMQRHHDLTKTSVPWASADFRDVHDYLLHNFVPNMRRATLVAATTSVPVRIVNTTNNRFRASTLKAALDELTRAMLFLKKRRAVPSGRGSASTRR